MKLRPNNLTALQERVRAAAAAGQRIQTADAPAPELDARPALTIDLGQLCGFVSADPVAGTATFLAGTTVGQAAAELAAHNLSIIGAPSNPRITLGYAVSYGVHSGAPRDRSFSGSVTGVSIVLANGSLIEVSARKNAHYWGAARLTLGAIGVIATVTVRVREYRTLRVKRGRSSIAELVRDLPEAHRKVDYYSATFRPGRDTANLTLGWLVKATPAEVAARPAQLSSVTEVNAPRPGLFTRIRRAVTRIFRGTVDRDEVFGDGVALAEGRDVSATADGGPQVEYQFPLYRAGLVLGGLQELARGNSAFSRAQGRFGMLAADDVWLSPAYGQDVFTVAVTVPNANGQNLNALHQAEELFIYLGGLPSWAGWNTFRAGEANDVMPRYSDFAHIAHDLDPHGTFGNLHTARVVH